MITTFAVTSDNDIYLNSDGNVALLFGQDAVMQLCEHASKTILGEMILFSNQGMPNFQTIWQPGIPNLPQFQTALHNTLMLVDGVIEVNSIGISVVDSRINGLAGNGASISTGNTAAGKSLAYSVTISTIYGQGTLGASIPI
jgi:hypothetical protein